MKIRTRAFRRAKALPSGVIFLPLPLSNPFQEILAVIRNLFHSVWDAAGHFWGRVTGRYYFEDFVRVYPNETIYNLFGKPQKASQDDINNFKNHQKFYRFAAQFVHKGDVADIGCGSGHGCEILKASGAASVQGADISKSAIAFARKHFFNSAKFSIQGITDLSLFRDNSFDLVVSSEVLEHIKEYGKERRAISEIKRITRPGGIVVLGTPNSELLGGHGFYFDEINKLLSGFFGQYCIFENSLVPFGDERRRWESRLDAGDTGIVVSQNITLSETMLPKTVTPELKQGIDAGVYQLGGLAINTALLHNTHSWIIVAVKD